VISAEIDKYIFKVFQIQILSDKIDVQSFWILNFFFLLSDAIGIYRISNLISSLEHNIIFNFSLKLSLSDKIIILKYLMAYIYKNMAYFIT